jgi:hypothetical protein
VLNAESSISAETNILKVFPSLKDEKPSPRPPGPANKSITGIVLSIIALLLIIPG